LPRKILKGDYNYNIPGGHFHNAILRGALSGWTVRGILGWRSGVPLNVVSGSDFYGNGRSAGQRPDDVPTVDPYVENVGALIWLTPTAFSTTAVKAQKRFGNLGYMALLGPTAFTMDTGLHKTFNMTERQRITLRLEVFNVLNHVTFGNPNTTLNNTLFGLITSAGSPRAFQVALKYVF
jgi:hypothetical protein